MDQKDNKMIDLMYVMAKQFLETYEKSNRLLIVIEDKNKSELDNGTIIDNGKDKFDKMIINQDLNGNSIGIKNSCKDDSSTQSSVIRPNFIDSEEDILLKQIEDLYREKFPLNFINELQQHSSRIFETETSFSEQKMNNRTIYTFKTSITNTKFFGMGSDGNKKEAKRKAGIELIRILLKDSEYRETIRNYLTLTGENKFLGKKRENHNLLNSASSNLLKYKCNQLNNIEDSPKNSISSNNLGNYSEELFGKTTTIVDLTKVKYTTQTSIHFNDAKMKENISDKYSTKIDTKKELLEGISNPDFKKEFDVFCLVKERSLMLNYKEIIDLNDIIKDIESTTTSTLEGSLLLKCGSFQNNTLRRTFISVDLILLLKISLNQTKEELIEKIKQILTISLEKYENISISKQKPNLGRYQYLYDNFISISLTRNKNLITINYYFRDFEDDFTKKIVKYMAFFSKIQITLNQLIAITLIKEWRRKNALIELKSEIIEIFISNSQYAIVGQIVFEFLLDLAKGALEGDMKRYGSNMELLVYYISNIDEENKIKIKNIASSALRNINQDFNDFL